MILQVSPAFTLRELFQFLQEFGFYEYILPFLLVVAIVFAILEKTQIFGSDKKNINVIVALVVGLLLVAQQSIVQTINLFLPRVSLIIVVILMFLVVLTMFGKGTYEGLQGVVLTGAVIVAIIAVILALSPNFGYDISWLAPYDRSMLLTIGVLVGIVLLLYWLLAGKKGANQDGLLSRVAKDIESSLRGGGKS